ncbi:hypothetical protein [Lactobacillus sp. ESL0245]|uniref:hypothetical protein n=1 Tax=Lactobacillus sp. ESL0245 TaxID=2069358 RepID=UPI0013144018|nr:hypothetical protein [Lactobacillus sp. ESL0245]
MKLAVTYGSFNFVSIGHVNLLETILKEWSQVFVLILPNNNICNHIVYPDKDTNDFLSMCNDSIQKKKLLPIVDRVNALSLVIKNNPKLIGKVHIAVFCRPDANISFFDACYLKKILISFFL